MSLVVNNNMMAANTARNLNAHYGRLATSTQRLSSGLRINSAADDAAGLAIRELQRADIAALHQGARNANDAISMIQVADGSLGIIDEKLIRMKELAEQAATGTYDSTQRLMIESEYQAMASEITRIANSTDFNGTKLLDGTLAGDHDGSKMVSEGKIKIHFGTGNDSAEDYYYIEIGECTSEALGLGNNSTWQDVQRRGVEAFKDSLLKQIKADTTISDEERGKLLAGVDKAAEQLQQALTNATNYEEAWKLWSTDGTTGFMEAGKNFPGTSDLMDKYLAAAAGDANIDNIYNKYLELKGAQTSIDQAKLNDTQAWIDAQNATTGTATEEQIYVQYLKDKGLQTSIEEAKANDEAAWNTAANGTTGTASFEEIYAAYLDVKGALGSAAEVQADDAANGTTLWDDAKTAATTNLGRTPTEDEIYEQYLATKGVHFPVADAATNDTADWNTAKTNADANATPTDEQIWVTYLTNGNAQTSAADAIANDNAAWLAAKTTADKDAQTDEDTYKQYLATYGAETSAEDAEKLNDADWVAAKESLKVGSLKDFWDGLSTTQQQKLQYAWGQAAIYNLANAPLDREPGAAGIGAPTFDFAQIMANDTDDNMLAQAFKDMQAKVGHMDFAGHTIETQEDAQMALTAINNAIVSKDKIRAHLGAAQNRLENTVSNLNIQAENLQAAESRISDVDVATEMTQFVRNQILTQSAVAMLSQANSLPQMAMQLIGG